MCTHTRGLHAQQCTPQWQLCTMQNWSRDAACERSSALPRRLPYQRRRAHPKQNRQPAAPISRGLTPPYIATLSAPCHLLCLCCTLHDR